MDLLSGQDINKISLWHQIQKSFLQDIIDIYKGDDQPQLSVPNKIPNKIPVYTKQDLLRVFQTSDEMSRHIRVKQSDAAGVSLG